MAIPNKGPKNKNRKEKAILGEFYRGTIGQNLRCTLHGGGGGQANVHNGIGTQSLCIADHTL